MVRCIKCSWELKILFDKKTLQITGYECINPACELNNEKKDENNWSLAEHKDNQSWAVRHIRALEADNQALKEQITKLQEKVEVLVQKLEGI